MTMEREEIPRIDTDALLEETRRLCATMAAMFEGTGFRVALLFNELDQRMKRGDVPTEWNVVSYAPSASVRCNTCRIWSSVTMREPGSMHDECGGTWERR